jgi:hypothetical protein
MALDPYDLAEECARRLSVAADNAELLEALDAAADDVVQYAGLTELPDEPRVRRPLVPYAAAIFLSADAPVGSYGALADDTFPTLPIPANLHAKYAPRFAFLNASWGIG